MQLEVGQGTHTGMVRSGNEDSFFADPPAGLFVVADGMGGHAAGEIASDMAVRIVSDELRVVRDITSELRVLTTVALPSATLPSVSCLPSFHTASQLPMSDQEKEEGTTAALAVFSMIA